MRNVECGIDIPASSLELSFSFRIPNSTLRISPEADRMLLFLTVTSLALQAPVADTSPFRALPLPAANRVRNASGAPGPDYWQQRADYVIRATLDTAGSVIRGSERIHYENHSPDTLAFVWVQIEQNIFARNSVTYALNQPPLHFAGGAVFDFTGKGFIGGITIERFRAIGRELARTEYGTMMRVELPRPLAPHRTIDFEVAWHFPVPPYGGGRMGRIGTRLYEIGQWYPRIDRKSTRLNSSHVEISYAVFCLKKKKKSKQKVDTRVTPGGNHEAYGISLPCNRTTPYLHETMTHAAF